jgi:hypothetical protein
LFWDLTCEFAGVFEGVLQKKLEIAIFGYPGSKAIELWLVEH